MIQIQFLNYLLSTQDASILTLNNLNSEFFSDCSAEFSFIKNHLDMYGKIPDMETFLSRFESFPVLKVTETPNYLLQELYNDRNERFLASTFNKIRELLHEDKITEAMNLYANSSNIYQTVNLQSVDILRDTSRYDSYLERTQDFNKYYCRTGFKELDNIIGGWDREEELATIVARPNVGKSWILLKCATAAVSQGLTVGIYSGEMSDRKVGYRLDTLIGHIPNGSLVHGNVSIQPEYKKFIDELPGLYDGTIKVLTPVMLGGPAGVNTLRSFIEKDKLDILFIDQHSLLEDDRNAKNPIERAANISKDLKNLQVLKKIPIVAVSQQNRTTAENGADTSQIAQTDRIGQDSTCVIFIEKKEDLMKLSLVKSRDSVNGKILTYQVDLNKGEFNFIPSSDDATSETSEDLAHRYDKEATQGGNVF